MFLLIFTFTGLLFSALGESLLPLFSMWALGLIWMFVPYRGVPGLIVLPLAISFQWLQITFGLFYMPLTGIELRSVQVDYAPYVMIGLASLVFLSLGINRGMAIGSKKRSLWEKNPQSFLSFKLLIYFNFFILYFKNIIISLAWSVPVLTQPVVAIVSLKIGVLYLILLGLLEQRKYLWVWLIVFIEVIWNATNFFADFRISLIMFFVAIIDTMIGARRSKFQNQLILQMVFLIALTTAVGTIWTGIKSDWRYYLSYQSSGSDTQLDKLSVLGNLISNWHSDSEVKETSAAFGNRMWEIYYSSLVVERVPSIIPHENGGLIFGALKHIFMPRIFFPDKPILFSESFKVRKYAGVMVAGGYGNRTNHAFSYITESYVDFGVPLMFVPLFIFGVIVGIIFQVIVRTVRDYYFKIMFILALGWTALGRYEASWGKLLGNFGTMLGYTIFVYMVFFVVMNSFAKKRF
ncbi:hypothetical protein [Magnetococcus sp. PR-3]|uniref:hypothetical protein n=1 Tax=Magnetococcus sp. PR-3 TaxID=3120355 RepID=UPI002FCE253D